MAVPAAPPATVTSARPVYVGPSLFVPGKAAGGSGAAGVSGPRAGESRGGGSGAGAGRTETSGVRPREAAAGAGGGDGSGSDGEKPSRKLAAGAGRSTESDATTEDSSDDESDFAFRGAGAAAKSFPAGGGRPTGEKHPLEGWTVNQVVEQANRLGLKTPRDQLILWSGLGRGGEGKKLSQEYAKEHGGITLEMTEGGKWLDALDLFGVDSPFSPQVATEIWAKASRIIAKQASGQVRALVGAVHPKGLYMSDELFELRENPAVLGVEEIHLKPRFRFGK